MTILLVFLGFGEESFAQQSSRAKKKLQKYEDIRQSMIDTSFKFITKKVDLPRTPNRGTGGLVFIENGRVDIWELLWLDRNEQPEQFGAKERIQQYVVSENQIQQKITVRFAANMRGATYYFEVEQTFGKQALLRVTEGNRFSLLYRGSIKPLKK